MIKLRFLNANFFHFKRSAINKIIYLLFNKYVELCGTK